MTTNDMTRLVQQAVEELWNQGELALADKLFAPNYVNHGGLIPDLGRGPEAVKLSVIVHRLAFPALHVTVDAHATQGNTIALRWSARNASERAGSSVPTDDTDHVLRGVTFGRFAGRQLEESWTYWDTGAKRT